MIERFILRLLSQAVQDEEIKAFVFQLVDHLVDKLKADLLPDIIATFPAFGASVAKSLIPNISVGSVAGDVAEIATNIVDHILSSDPDIPGLSDIIDLSELARRWLK